MMTGRLVNEPWPISAAGATMVMMPSGAIVSQTFGVYAAGASAKASSMRASASGAIVSAKLSPAVVLRKLRRFTILLC